MALNKSIHSEAWKLLKDFIGGPWKEIRPEDIILHKLKGGYSNKIYRCSLPDTKKSSPTHPYDVLLRLYGHLQDNVEKVASEVAVFVILSEKNLGPKLYGVFERGRIEQYIPSHILNSDDMRRYASQIAREIAKIHALNVPLNKSPSNWKDKMQRCLEEVKNVLSDDNYYQIFGTYDEYITEFEWIIGVIEEAMSPVVFCHNDLTVSNILYREDVSSEDNPVVMFIDFEFGMYNYRGFDIANYLIEWCFDYETKDFPHFACCPDKFPSRNEQENVVENYLLQLQEEDVVLEDPLQEKCKILDREIPIFVCASHLMWHILCMKMIPIFKGEFSFKEYTKTRGQMYKLAKKQYLSSIKKEFLR